MTSKDSRCRGAKKTSKRFELAGGLEAHPLLRMAGCLPMLALAWLFLRPGGAALATVIVVLSFALRSSLAMCGLVLVLASGHLTARSPGSFPGGYALSW
jgi:hypothetical protein